ERPELPRRCAALRECARRDLNPHAQRHRNLNPACLPIPPRARALSIVVPHLGSVRNQYPDSAVRDVTGGLFMSNMQPAPPSPPPLRPGGDQVAGRGGTPGLATSPGANLVPSDRWPSP